MVNSRRLALKWPYRRHKVLEKELRIAASKWFKDKGYPTNPHLPYCLSNWSEWKKNIILQEVASYIEDFKEKCEKEKNPFPLHKYIHHGLSSQAMAFNLIGPLITRRDLEPLLRLLKDNNGVTIAASKIDAEFEYEDREVFNEDAGQPTSIDIILKNEMGKPIIFIESKLAEKDFGGCSVFSDGDCNGQNPLSDKNQCYLHFIGRKYWQLIEKYGFLEALKPEKQCILANHYQYFREVLFSIEKGGVFVLLSDERNPAFHCMANGINKGLMPFLLQFIPDKYKDRIASISIQELVHSIKRSSRHRDWIEEFEVKYGLA